MLMKEAQNAIDYRWLGDDGDDFHLGAAVAKQRIGFEDAADQLRPRPPRGTPLGW